MPLVVEYPSITQRSDTGQEILFERGTFPLSSVHLNPVLKRLRIPRLKCLFRSPPSPGAFEAIFDTGAPVSIIPFSLWNDRFRWREGVHFEVCEIEGLGRNVEAQVLSANYQCMIARLKVPVVLSGLHGDRTQLDQLITQLPLTREWNRLILGLWGGIFEDRQLMLDRLPNTDELGGSIVW